MFRGVLRSCAPVFTAVVFALGSTRRTLCAAQKEKKLEAKDPYIPAPPRRECHVVLETPKRLIIIGDVHGCVRELDELVAKCGYNSEKDVVIIVGDLVNKGPESNAVVTKVRTAGYVCIRGNHDDYALSKLEKRRKITEESEMVKFDEQNKVIAWTKGLSPENEAFLRALPYTISLPQYNAIIVHAGLKPGVPLEEQDFGTMYRMRNIVIKKDGETGKVEHVCTDKPTVGEPWAKVWSGPQKVIFGHDAMRGLQLFPFALGIDTGCCYGNLLTAYILPEGRFVQVQAHEVYEAPKGVKS